MVGGFRNLEIGAWFLDALFPEFCVLCEREGKSLCRVCELRWIADPSLDRFASGSPTVRGVFSLSPYPDPVMKGLLRQWKYWGQRSAGETLLRLVDEVLEVYEDALPIVDAVAAVPLHQRRLNFRGFDQAAMIAQCVATRLNKPLGNLLERVVYTIPQAKQEREERRNAELQNAFRVCPQALTKLPARVLLVDDVWTSGATMRAAARVLRQAGAQEVWGFTCARG